MGVLDGLETTLKNCRLYYQWHRKEEADAPTVLLLHGFLPEMTVFWGFRLITACFFDRDHAFPQRKHNFPVCGKLLYRGFSTGSFPHKMGFAGQNRAFSVENYVES